MQRLFGTNKKEAPPSLSDSITKVDARIESLDQKIRKLDLDLQKGKQQLTQYPPGSSAHDTLKQQILRTLHQKKTFEQQLSQMRQQSFNMEQANFATSTLQDTVHTVKAMETAAKEMKRSYKQVNVDKVERVQEELEELMAANEEIQELMGRSYSTPLDLDEADMEAELALLEESPVDDYLDSLPLAPAQLPISASSNETHDSREKTTLKD